MLLGIVALVFTEYDVAREILKLPCKTWIFRATSYSVNSQGNIFGILSVNNDLVVFQYLFCILNSLQVSFVLSYFTYLNKR